MTDVCWSLSSATAGAFKNRPNHILFRNEILHGHVRSDRLSVDNEGEEGNLFSLQLDQLNVESDLPILHLPLGTRSQDREGNPSHAHMYTTLDM